MQNREMILQSQRQSFRDLLHHVWRRSSFYRDLYSGSGIRESEIDEIMPNHLPLIDKKLLMEHFDEAVADPRLRKHDLGRWIHDNRDPAANFLDKYIVVHSSGSSGDIGIFVYSRAERQLAASTMASHLPLPEHYGAGKTKVAFYLASHSNFGGVSYAARMPRSIYDTVILSAFDSEDYLTNKLNEYQPHQLQGYTSSIYHLSQLAIAGKLRISPKRITVGGEKLTRSMEKAIHRAWDVPIYDVYQASESSFIAIRRPGSDEMDIITDLNILEVLDENNLPALDGQPGRVVLTNLYNYTLPIIRYQLGDYAALDKATDASPVPTIKDIVGRASDPLPVVLQDGRIGEMNPHIGLYVPGLEKYQLVSVRPDFVQIDYIAEANLDSAIADDFQRILDLRAASKTKFEVRRVARIATDPRTGKVPLIVTKHQEKADRIQCQYEDEVCRVSQSTVDRRQTYKNRNNLQKRIPPAPPAQEAIRAECFRSTGTFVEFSREDVERSIPARFEKMVRIFPQNIAVKTEQTAITYDELNRTANRLAQAIIVKHGTAQVPIMLVFDDVIQGISAILGVLKAGKSFVAVDSSLPSKRIKFIAQDCATKMLITNRANLVMCNQLTGGDMEVLDLETTLAGGPDNNLSLEVSPDTQASVYYTSGSTGQPKGVVQTHRGILHRVMVYTTLFHLCADDRITFLHSYSATSSMHHLFGSILNGAGLYPFNAKSGAGRLMASWLIRERITVYHSIPLMFRKMASSLTNGEIIAHLRTINLSAAPMSIDELELYKKHVRPTCILVHLLGGAENGFICAYFMNHQTKVTENPVPVGFSLPDKEVMVVNEEGNSVDFDEVGEIAVRSRYLADGYWRQHDLTETKFSSDPTGGEKRLYLTGDLGRILADGCLVHIGRKDFRVKVHGYGVDTFEVENALINHPAVQEAAVAACEDEERDTQLIGYYVSTTTPGPSIAELRVFLQERLPDYMIPSRFVALESLPLNPNGKVDRRALPHPGRTRPKLSTVYVRPESLVEMELSQTWAQALSIDKVGIHDNFFELGGHSLLATQLISRIRDAFGFEMPLRSLFESPTVAGLAERIGSRREGESPIGAFSIIREPIYEEYPLSFSQGRFWFLEQLEPNNSAYKVAYAFRLTGPLNIEALERTLSEIMSRHGVLRTTFHLSDDKLVQRISDPEGFRLSITDLRQKCTGDLDAEIQGLFENEYRTPFHLSTDLLLRATLLRFNDDEHILFLNSHHIASDHWSAGLLFREMSTLYKAFAAGKPSPLPSLSIQYKHYAQWQRRMFQGSALERHLEYWKEQLNTAPLGLDLPTDGARKPLSNRRGGRETVTLPKSLSDNLDALSRKGGVTVFMTFLGAFQTLLHRMTGQEDIVIGTPVAGRDRTETEKLIGLFLNTLALRTNLSGNPTFVELLKRVREVALGAYDHQDLPFEKLVEELQQERDLTRTPIFQVFLNMYNFEETTLGLEGVSVTRLQPTKLSTQFDISLFILEQNDRTRLTLQYDADLFTSATMTRMLSHFQTLLEGIVANPEQRIADLPILSEGEKHQVLVEWNDTKIDYPKDKCIHHLFEEQAKRTPESVAVIFEDQQLTYRELNNRANQLAHYLHKLGVGPEVLVGICVERSVEMVVAMLAVLKAGGAYVPLDPSYPTGRLEFMLADAQVSVLLTQEGLLEDGGSRMDDSDRQSSILDRPMQRICLDRDWELIARESDADPPAQTGAERLAYVMYTSGSAGLPKGVEVPHQAIIRLLFGVDYVELGPKQNILQLASPAFDAATFEIWGALLHGGKSVLYPERVPSPEKLGEILGQHNVNTFWLTASLFNTIIDTAPEALSAVRQLLVGGEALSVAHVRRALALLPNTALINGYGPTEGATFTCCSRIPRELDDGIATIPIGRPIGNTKVYILDASLSPVPMGVPGEMYIGGDGLARGYLGRPDLTAEKFIPNPFSTEPGARLYKTGDRARYLSDGNIEFLGRSDNQVKIRGYRIELGEIEAVLGQYPSVREAVVLAREDGPEDPTASSRGDKRLVAYVVATNGTLPSVSELRSFLQQKLPEYMVPSAFMFLDSLSLTANGKLDRKALPAPDHSRPELDETFSAPQTAIEELLANIWAEVLKLDEVGIYDNFFDLGGHSLLATQVMSRVRQALQKELPLRALFEAPTVAQLALRIEPSAIGSNNLEELARTLAEVELLSEEEINCQLVKKN